MYILGISAFYHDSAACLVKDGDIVAAAQEERFTRKKHDHRFPGSAIDYCLSEANITTGDLDYIAFYDKPFIKFERILESYLATAPFGVRSYLKAIPMWLKQKLDIRKEIRRNLPGFEGEIIFPEHHESHSASAFYPSPFTEAAILTLDGVGEWTTTSYGTGRKNKIDIISEIRFPHSLGLLYSAFTYYLGFKVNSGEYKVMGLAPYGEPKYTKLMLDNLIDIKRDGSYRLNMEYFDYVSGLTMSNHRFHELFGKHPRRPEGELTQKDMDIAASVQKVLEEAILRIARHLRQETGLRSLCMAGGVALNCVANSRILEEEIFPDIWVQPAAGDAGGALGSALFVWYQYLENKRTVHGNDFQKGSLLGPKFSDESIQQLISEGRFPHTFLKKSDLLDKVTDLLIEGKVIGWFQNRMEFGPRALGARSIIGDPRNPAMQREMNLRIKFRESFRPFAPSVLYEFADDWFDLTPKSKLQKGIRQESPYMLFVAPVKGEKRIESADHNENLTGIQKLNIQRSTIPAVTHVDYSARIQTVHKETNPLFYELIYTFYEKTGCPVLINTSFNVRGEPIVCTPEDAYRCFMRTHIDYLVMGSVLLEKERQPGWEEDRDWKTEFELD